MTNELADRLEKTAQKLAGIIVLAQRQQAQRAERKLAKIEADLRAMRAHKRAAKRKAK